MNNTIRSIKSITLRAGLLGAALSLAAAPSFAAPHDRRDDAKERRDDARDVRRERKDVKEARKEVERDRRDVRHADTPEERRREARDLSESQQRLRREQQDLRGERSDYKRDTRGRTGNRPVGNRPVGNRPIGNRPVGGSYGNSGYGNSGYGYGGQRLTGTVTSVRSSQSFDVRIGSTTYNVYTLSRLPRGLSTGDVVRVNGSRENKNDIRNASVSIVSNR